MDEPLTDPHESRAYTNIQQTGCRDTMVDHSADKDDELESNIKYPFWFGGSASALAACVTHPLDLGTAQRPLLVKWN